ncbi:MAG: AGE family epimerase/isomerase, partial [Candidatus Bathyarchaeia archaeon]
MLAVATLGSPSAFAGGAPADAPRDWMAVFRENLQQGVLQFWIDHAIDPQYGGVIGRLDREGKPIPPGDKSLVIISRTMWSFAQAYRRYPHPAYKEVATTCLKFLRDKMWDKQKGGYYFMVSR